MRNTFKGNTDGGAAERDGVREHNVHVPRRCVEQHDNGTGLDRDGGRDAIRVNVRRREPDHGDPARGDAVRKLQISVLR